MEAEIILNFFNESFSSIFFKFYSWLLTKTLIYSFLIVNKSLFIGEIYFCFSNKTCYFQMQTKLCKKKKIQKKKRKRIQNENETLRTWHSSSSVQNF